MRYQGSKKRLAKLILPIILKDRTEGQWYVEPFVGAFNMIENVKGNRIGNDLNYYIIKLYQAVQRGWIPPTSLSVEEYKHIKDNKDLYYPQLVGFVGFGCSFGGKWFGGYARGGFKYEGTSKSHCLESHNSILKQAPKIQGIEILNQYYQDLVLPKNSIIYCDPPYANTTNKYSSSFDADVFWDWVRAKVEDGHQVFVSEYQAPPDFKCVFEKQLPCNLSKKVINEKLTYKKATEKLFIKN